MTRLLTAIYENGVFRPLEDPGLEGHQKVTVEIMAEPEISPDDALAAWQRVYQSGKSRRSHSTVATSLPGQNDTLRHSAEARARL